MPVDAALPVVTTLMCFFNLHVRLRVHRAPGIPCALFSRVTLSAQLARYRREDAKTRLLFDN